MVESTDSVAVAQAPREAPGAAREAQEARPLLGAPSASVAEVELLAVVAAPRARSKSAFHHKSDTQIPEIHPH